MITIDSSADLHTLINTFTVRPERQVDVVDCLRRFTEFHTRDLPGYVGTAVHTSLDGKRVVNYVQWRSADDLARMLSTAAASTHLAEVQALSESVQPILYRVAFAGAS